MRDLNIFYQEQPDAVFSLRLLLFFTMDEANPTIKERQIYHEMKLTPAMVKSIRTLCGVCLRHYVETKAFKIAIVPNKDRCMETCTVCQTRRGYDYVVMPR